MAGWKNFKTKISGRKTNESPLIVPQDEDERTRMLLGKIHDLHIAKLNILGISYQALGNAAWLVLCDIYLHNLNGQYLSIGDLERSQSLAPSNSARYVKVLQQEGLVAQYPVDTDRGAHNLQLTKLGASKVRLILDQFG